MTHAPSTTFTLMLGALLTGAVTRAAIAQASDVRNAAFTDAMLAVEDARFAAMTRGDTAALAGMLAEDLVYVHSSGRVETRAQFLQAVGSQSIRYLKFAPVERQVMPVGEAGVVIVGRSDVRVILGGQELDFDVRHIGVYHRIGGRWVLRAWQTTRVTPPSGR